MRSVSRCSPFPISSDIHHKWMHGQAATFFSRLFQTASTEDLHHPPDLSQEGTTPFRGFRFDQVVRNRILQLSPDLDADLKGTTCFLL